MRVNMNEATALKLVAKLQGDADPDLARLRESVQRATDPSQSINLSADDLQAIIAVVAGEKTGHVPQVWRRMAVDRALPKLRGMLQRQTDREQGVTAQT